MKRLVLLAIAAAPCSSAIALPARTPELIGTWNLDRAASRLRGDLIVIGAARGGYRFDFGAVQFTLLENGTFQPTVGGRETSLRRTGPGTWERVHRIHGRDVDRSTLEVSADTRVLTIRTTSAGSTETIERLDRVKPGRGLAGAWRSRRAGVNVPTQLTFSRAPGHAIQWGSPQEGNYYVVAPGGRPAPNRGATAVAGVTLQVTKPVAGKLTWIERVRGRPYRLGEISLAKNGRRLTETSWPANHPSERQVASYRRD